MSQAGQEHLDLVRAAAQRGVHQAQVIFGQMLLDGVLMARNPVWALYWFERAANAGNITAMNMAGRCFDQGWGVAACPALAAPWFLRAAEAGLDWGMYNYATLLVLGRGVPEDKVAGYRWLRRAADLQHAKSVNLLAGFHEDGWVVPRNLSKAAALYRHAAVLGDFRGQFNYARLLALAGHVEQAAEWVRLLPETATAAFLEKARQFFLTAPEETTRSLANLLGSNLPALEPSPQLL